MNIENVVFQTRILVTHNLTLLPHTDLIIVMEEGRISQMGTYQELISRRANFAELVQVFSSERTSEETNPVEGEKICILCLLNIFTFHSRFLIYSLLIFWKWVKELLEIFVHSYLHFATELSVISWEKKNPFHFWLLVLDVPTHGIMLKIFFWFFFPI